MKFLILLLVLFSHSAWPESVKELNQQAFLLHKDLTHLARKEYELRQRMVGDLEAAEKTLALYVRLTRWPEAARLAENGFNPATPQEDILAYLKKDLLHRIRHDRKALKALLATATQKQEKLENLATLLKKRAGKLKNKKDLNALFQAVESTSHFSRALTNVKGKKTPLPSGKVLTAFGKKNKSGLPEKGTTILTAPGTEIRALKNGTVIYSGPFQQYGQLLILDHGKNTFTLYGGLAGEPYYTVGDLVGGGDVLGKAPVKTDPKIYIEARKGKKSVDPLRI